MANKATITAMVQGKTYTLIYNETSGCYETQVQAGEESSFLQPNGYFPISITAVDETELSTTVDSSDSAFGEKLRLFTYEENKPEITIISPSANAYITETTKPEFKFEVRENKSQSEGFSGINIDSVVLKINDVLVEKSAINFELSDDNSFCTCTYIPDTDIADGEVIITVNASDNDGNSADTATVKFNIDNLAPQLDVTSPGSNYSATSNSTVLVEGITSDTSKPITVTIALNGTIKRTIEVAEGDGGRFSSTIELDTQGNNEITVAAIDKTGKSTVITRTVKYNTTAPKFEDVEIIYKGEQISANNKVPAIGMYTIRCRVTTL